MIISLCLKHKIAEERFHILVSRILHILSCTCHTSAQNVLHHLAISYSQYIAYKYGFNIIFFSI